MAETTAESSATFKPFDFIDQLYDQTNAACSQSIAFGLFDVQLCGALDFAWLLQQVECISVKEQELKQIFDSGLIKTWTDKEGVRGFLLYTPEQVKTLKNLQEIGRYSCEELQYIMSSWDADIECTLEVVPYDDPEIPEIEHYRQKFAEHIAETKQQISWLDRDSAITTEESRKRLDYFNQELLKWEAVARRVDSWDPAALTPEMQNRVDRGLFRLRLVDEWVRVGNAERFRSAITQGFSPGVFFSSYSQDSDGFTFERIDWRLTLRSLRQTRSEGKRFPLRTPDFDLTETGLILRKPLAPEAYAGIHERYQFGEMAEAINDLGQGLWNPPTRMIDSAACAECATPSREASPQNNTAPINVGHGRNSGATARGTLNAPA